jgi:DNA mismatch endonuclease (patch repair protein)
LPDVVDQKTRSRMMAGIKGKNTKPELAVRSALHRQGYRFRLHRKDLPGRPDITLPQYSALIFVNGCFWHGHDCHLFRLPQTRTDFWRTKIEGNRERDTRNQSKLLKDGWALLRIWECALRGRTALPFTAVMAQVTDWLEASDRPASMDIRGTA